MMERFLDYGLAGGVILLFSLISFYVLKSIGSFFRSLVDPKGNDGQGGLLYQLVRGHLELLGKLEETQSSMNSKLNNHIKESRGAFDLVRGNKTEVDKLVKSYLWACDLVELLCKKVDVWNDDVEKALMEIRSVLRNGKAMYDKEEK